MKGVSRKHKKRNQDFTIFKIKLSSSDSVHLVLNKKDEDSTLFMSDEGEAELQSKRARMEQDER